MSTPTGCILVAAVLSANAMLAKAQTCTMQAMCQDCSFTSSNYYTIGSSMNAQQCTQACLADAACGGVTVGKNVAGKSRAGYCYGYRGVSVASSTEAYTAYDTVGKSCTGGGPAPPTPPITPPPPPPPLAPQRSGSCRLTAVCQDCEFDTDDYTELGASLSPQQCKQACLADAQCMGATIGKDVAGKSRAGMCYGYRAFTTYEAYTAYDVWMKEGACLDATTPTAAPLTPSKGGQCRVTAVCTDCEFDSDDYYSFGSDDYTKNQCKQLCIADPQCAGVTIGKDVDGKLRQGACYAYRTFTTYETYTAYDAWMKEGACLDATTPAAATMDTAGACRMDRVCTGCEFSASRYYQISDGDGLVATEAECQAACLRNPSCLGVTVGKDTADKKRKGVCYGYHETGATTSYKAYDGWVKAGACDPVEAPVDTSSASSAGKCYMSRACQDCDNLPPRHFGDDLTPSECKSACVAEPRCVSVSIGKDVAGKERAGQCYFHTQQVGATNYVAYDVWSKFCSGAASDLGQTSKLSLGETITAMHAEIAAARAEAAQLRAQLASINTCPRRTRGARSQP